MIPQQNIDFTVDFEVEVEPSKTYKLNTDMNRIIGSIDQKEALKQAISTILNVERYDYLIYSWNFGVELKDLIGKPISYVQSELKRRITEALTQDDRILDVDAFYFDVKKKKVHVTFTVHSIFGDFESNKVVSI